MVWHVAQGTHGVTGGRNSWMKTSEGKSLKLAAPPPPWGQGIVGRSVPQGKEMLLPPPGKTGEVYFNVQPQPRVPIRPRASGWRVSFQQMLIIDLFEAFPSAGAKCPFPSY